MNLRQTPLSDESKHSSEATIGILVANLGTPDAPDFPSLRRYLKEFLWDPRIVDMPRLIWWFILQVILIIRPSRSAHAYQQVWDAEKGSPLLFISQAQVSALKKQLSSHISVPYVIELGMRYGNPSIASALEKLRQANAQKILVLPLYPQYSSSTTASTFDAVAQTVKNWRWVPEFRFINQYHDHPEYINALATTVREAWNQHEQPQKLVCSFHGTPTRFLMQGDPYYCQCSKTARLLAEKLQLNENQWKLCFQSIFGREPWLQPYTIETLQAFPKQDITSVDVICPGFSADCLETLEEIEMQNRDAFIEAGGKQYHYIPALNERSVHIRALSSIILEHITNWPEAIALVNDKSELQARPDRAKAAELETG